MTAGPAREWRESGECGERAASEGGCSAVSMRSSRKCFDATNVFITSIALLHGLTALGALASLNARGLSAGNRGRCAAGDADAEGSVHELRIVILNCML